MADPTRREILARMIAKPCSVSEVAEGLPMTKPNVSQHLRVLREADLVEVRAEGTRRIYSPRWEGLTAFRREVESFWGSTLENFKTRVERDHHDAVRSRAAASID